CHHIEDPTFDATAAATNPRARMRPVHRPPRTPVDRHPHCRWTVDIEPAAEALPFPEAAERVGRSLAASVVLGPDVSPSYDGPFDPDFRLESLPPAALERALAEVCLQGHVLVHSFLLTLSRRWGDAVATEVGVHQFTGIAGVDALRLARAFDLDLAGVLDLHPAFLPAPYVERTIERDGDSIVFALQDCAALEEVGGWSWPALLRTSSRPLEALVQAIDGRTRVTRSGELQWTITVDPEAEPAKEPSEVTLTKFSTGADFTFARR
ncbi:MAG: hypothetical protein QOJ09_415, partial [Actinomycetota bacterium]|nr:hypothetical protein [Actinomycetota bacterium]